MINIIELITHIHEEEAPDFPDNLDESYKNRILHLILRKQANNSEIPADFQMKSTVDNCIPKKYKRNPPGKRLWIAMFAAALLAGMAAFAANDGQWDIRLMEFWHLTDTTYLEGGNVLIDKSSTNNHMTLTARSSIGDKNNVSILLETDYTYDKSESDFLEENDCYFIFDTSRISVLDKNGMPAKGWSSVMESYLDKGKLYFLLNITCTDINRKKVSITCKDLYMYEKDSENKILINDGTWNLEWTFQYKANVKTYYPFNLADCGDRKVLITKIETTPLSIRVTGMRNYFEWDPAAEEESDIKKVYRGERQESVEFLPTVYGCTNRMFLEWNVVLKEPAEPGEISGIQIGETVLKLR